LHLHDYYPGKITIKTTVGGQLIQHQGIKVSLLGMILQLPEQTYKKSSEGMIINLDSKRSEITVQSIQKYKQYTFMQIQK